MIVETKSVPLSPATFAALVELRKIFHRTQIADFEPLARFSGLGELRFLFRSMLDLVCSVSFQKVSGSENVWESFRFLTIQKNLPDGMATWRDRCNRTSGPRAFSPGHTKHLLRAAYRSGYSPRSDVAFYAAAMAGQALERMPKPVPAASDMPTNCQYVFPTEKNHASEGRGCGFDPRRVHALEGCLQTKISTNFRRESLVSKFRSRDSKAMSAQAKNGSTVDTSGVIVVWGWHRKPECSEIRPHNFLTEIRRRSDTGARRLAAR